MLFLMQGFHHTGACEATGAQHLLQVFQFLLVPAVMTDSVRPVPKALDYSNQDLWMVVKVDVRNGWCEFSFKALKYKLRYTFPLLSAFRRKSLRPPPLQL